jgi:hypothetical protein
MRFETRFDKWLTGLLIGIGLMLFAMPIVFHFQLAGKVPPIWVFFFGPAIYVIALSATLPQYYEVREEGLFIRQGWHKSLLSYSSLCELSVADSMLSAAVFSTHRLEITAVPGGRFLIAVAEQDRFLDEVARRAPQLKRWASGLKIAGGKPSWL